MKIEDFVEGERYSYSTIAQAAGYGPNPGGNFERGIVLATKNNPRAIIIKLNLAKNLYDDEFVHGSESFYYIGDGLPERGHQKLRYGNKILVNFQHLPVYLFVRYKTEKSGFPWSFEGIWHITGIERDYISSKTIPNGERQRVFRYKLRKASQIPFDELFEPDDVPIPQYVSESDYLRVTPLLYQIIAPRHKRLANHLWTWLIQEGFHDIQLEQDRIDITFKNRDTTFMAELKTVHDVSSTYSIREAIGQVFEYNYYPPRTPHDQWLIVLDQKPKPSDREYISKLAIELGIPLNLGWQYRNDFEFIRPLIFNAQ